MAADNRVGIIADVATIVTAVAAVFAYSHHRYKAWQKRLHVERYLKDEKDKAKSPDLGHRLVLEVSAALALTEADVLQAAFDNKKIKRHLRVDPADPAKVVKWLILNTLQKFQIRTLPGISLSIGASVAVHHFEQRGELRRVGRGPH
jgi:hypothetical protein